MILGFACEETRKLFEGFVSTKFPPDIQRKAAQKLALLHAAVTLQDLRIFPGNRLEKLRGNREGQYSIRINDQWRLCFYWEDGNASDVEIVDYH